MLEGLDGNWLLTLLHGGLLGSASVDVYGCP